MKTSLIIRILIFSLLVSACNNKLFLQRKYTKGHYFAKKTSIEQSHKTTTTKTECAKVVKLQSIEFTKEKPLIQNEAEPQTPIKITGSKNEEGQNAQSFKNQQALNVAHSKKNNEALYFKNASKKKADLNTAVMSWAYAQLAASILAIPLIIILASSSSVVTTGIFLISLLLILAGTALAIKSVSLGNESIRGDGGFFSKLIGFWGLLNGAAAFILSFVVFSLLIALL